MKAFTVEWVFDDHLLSEDDGFTAQEMAEAGRLPVVRLAEVDALIQEAVWAMKRLIVERGDVLQRLHGKSPDEMTPIVARDLSYQRAQAFLASPMVAAWRERQEGKS